MTAALFKDGFPSAHRTTRQRIESSIDLQRLFFSWATIWQAKGRTEMVLQRLSTDPHSPPEFRCNQIVRNLDAFYEAFDVSPDDVVAGTRTRLRDGDEVTLGRWTRGIVALMIPWIPIPPPTMVWITVSTSTVVSITVRPA